MSKAPDQGGANLRLLLLHPTKQGMACGRVWCGRWVVVGRTSSLQAWEKDSAWDAIPPFQAQKCERSEATPREVPRALSKVRTLGRGLGLYYRGSHFRTLVLGIVHMSPTKSGLWGPPGDGGFSRGHSDQCHRVPS